MARDGSLVFFDQLFGSPSRYHRARGENLKRLDHQIITARAVAQMKIKRRRGGTVLNISMDAKTVFGILMVKEHLLERFGIAVEVEYHRLVLGEVIDEIMERHAAELVADTDRRDLEDTDKTQAYLGQVASDDLHCSKRLFGEVLARSGEHEVRILVARKIPCHEAGLQFLFGQCGREPARFERLACDDDIDAVFGRQTLFQHGERSIAVRREKDLYETTLFLEHGLNEARVLV